MLYDHKHLLGRPKLVNAPTVYNVSCGRMSVAWRQWSTDTDIGDPPVGAYE